MSIKQKAVEVMWRWEQAKAQYDDINKTLAVLNPDFPPRVEMIDGRLEQTVVALLDEVLGDEIASYYLYECSLMKDGGRIVDNGKEWPIKTLDDVLAYSERK